jgi:hypothetical protein
MVVARVVVVRAVGDRVAGDRVVVAHPVEGCSPIPQPTADTSKQLSALATGNVRTSVTYKTTLSASWAPRAQRIIGSRL